MGLDCSHDAWRGAYSAFAQWRNHLAEVAGYIVRPVQWQSDKEHSMAIPSPLLEWHRYDDDNMMGVWQELPADPLIILLAHSDSDGQISAEHVAVLADRLDELLPGVSGDFGGHVGDVRTKTETFIAGLRRASDAGEPLDFY